MCGCICANCCVFSLDDTPNRDDSLPTHPCDDEDDVLYMDDDEPDEGYLFAGQGIHPG